MEENPVSREEIRQKRRERRKLKKEQGKLLKEDAARKKLLQRDSQKVQILDEKTFDKFKSSTKVLHSEVVPELKNRRKRTQDSPKFSLLDYLAKKEKQKRIQKKDFINIPKVKKKGKVRARKHVTTLKKLIKRFRSSKLEEKNKIPQENKYIPSEKNAEAPVEKVVSPKTNTFVHSNSFRSYCDNTTSPLLSQQTEALIRKLNEFQRRALQKNEIKAKAHRRFVIGFREVKNHLIIKKLKLVIIATDCEKCDIEGGLDDVIESLKQLCQTDQEVPCCFSLKRRQLAFCLYKKVPVSCVGVLSYDGAQDLFHTLMRTLTEEKANYVKFFKT